MAKSKKRVPPKNDDELIAWSLNLLQVVGKKTGGTPPEWPHVAKDALATLEDSHLAFQTALTNYRETPTSALCKVKNEANAAHRKTISTFLNDYVRRNSHITPGNLAELHMSQPDTESTVVPKPAIECMADVDFPGIGLVRLYNFHPTRAPNEAEALALYGVGIRWGIMGAGSTDDPFRLTKVPLTGKDLPHPDFTRKRQLTLDLQGESGNKLYICLRYENQKGDKGPWGPMIVVNIP